MKIMFLQFGAIAGHDSLASYSIFGFGPAGTILFYAALILVVGTAFVWAAFFRKPGRHHLHHHRHHWRKERQGNDRERNSRRASRNFFGFRRHRHRRRRQQERPCNPTLAETGGLPPPRAGGQ